MSSLRCPSAIAHDARASMLHACPCQCRSKEFYRDKSIHYLEVTYYPTRGSAYVAMAWATISDEPSELSLTSPTARRRPSRISLTSAVISLASGLARKVDVQARCHSVDAGLSQGGDDRDVDAEIGKREHGWTGDGAAWPDVAGIGFHPHPRAAEAHLLDNQIAAARMDLGKACIDQRFDAFHIELRGARTG